MASYIILSKLSDGAFTEPAEFKELAATVSRRIREECPGINWKESYATMGEYDVVDIVECEDPKEVEKAAMMIRGFGKATTTTMVAAPWKEFLEAL